MHRTQGARNASNMFVDGSIAAGTRGTQVEQDWLNAVQEELCNFIEGLGVTLVKGTNNQLFTSLFGKDWALAKSGVQAILKGVAGGLDIGTSIAADLRILLNGLAKWTFRQSDSALVSADKAIIDTANAIGSGNLFELKNSGSLKAYATYLGKLFGYGLDAGSQVISNVANPVASGDAATRGWLLNISNPTFTPNGAWAVNGGQSWHYETLELFFFRYKLICPGAVPLAGTLPVVPGGTISFVSISAYESTTTGAASGAYVDTSGGLYITENLGAGRAFYVSGVYRTS